MTGWAPRVGPGFIGVINLVPFKCRHCQEMSESTSRSAKYCKKPACQAAFLLIRAKQKKASRLARLGRTE